MLDCNMRRLFTPLKARTLDMEILLTERRSLRKFVIYLRKFLFCFSSRLIERLHRRIFVSSSFYLSCSSLFSYAVWLSYCLAIMAFFSGSMSSPSVEKVYLIFFLKAPRIRDLDLYSLIVLRAPGPDPAADIIMKDSLETWPRIGRYGSIPVWLGEPILSCMGKCFMLTSFLENETFL